MSENDYDELRKRNIAERNAVFAEFFKDLKKQKDEVKELDKKYKDVENSENEPPKKRQYEEDLIKSRNNKPKLQVLFPWAKPFQRSIDLMKIGVCDVDEEEEQYNSDDSYDITKKRVYNVNKSPYDPDNIPSVDEITDEMLNNIAEKSSSKQYCKINGTCCHQCRQKTLDTKTVCRSGECVGLRGQFCGPCLKGRYGENAIDALKDPNWACPPCRGLCNCSICRTRNGLPPTGILAPLAQEEGYSSVMDYLQSAEINDT
ncbi:cell division cycle-associated protein 7-like isoform X2 [Apis laboriosa]|uniref:cell division cycle-associated protein 7-like isoform X2 n=1 Tax=Apis laboriosa TaxID=183418 RepID=UPI001CC5FE0C|nr:cell division cycle-associated protein 7-like isoform X2 [Apis laboriosa]